MLSLVGRLFALLLWLPLLVSKPFLRLGSRSRRARAARARAERRSAERERPVVRPTPTPAPEPSHAMLAELARVLNEEDTHRHDFRYLARFERKLRGSGLAALHEVPVKELRRALRDFETLVRNWSQPDLAALRSRMAVTLAERSSAASMWITANSVQSEWKPSREMATAVPTQH